MVIMSMVSLPNTHPDFDLLAPIVDALVLAGGGSESFSTQVADVFRQAIDEVIDAPRTRRYTISEIEKTEKTYLGTKVEILLRNLLKLPKGQKLDLLVNGCEVDIKNTIRKTWTIPLESVGHPALLLRADEKTSICDVGLILIKDEYLNGGFNRDQKRSISAAGLQNVWWLIQQEPYPSNFWEVLPPVARQAIMEAGSPTAQIAELFLQQLGKPVSRTQIQALAHQYDYMKRVRRNGGARDLLAPMGVAILWGQKDRASLRRFNIGPLTSEQFVAFRPTIEEDITYLRKLKHID